MKTMFDGQVVPRLRAAGLVGRVIVHRVINLFGKGESEIEALALDLTARGRVPEVGITASDATISFRIASEGATEDEARRAAEPTAALIYERFGDLIVGEKARRTSPTTWFVGSAPSGSRSAWPSPARAAWSASSITRIPGVSDVFLGGVVSYANAAKTDLLGVSPGLIASCGAVSGEVAEAMASGALARFGADLGYLGDRDRRAVGRDGREARRTRLRRAGLARGSLVEAAGNRPRAAPGRHPKPGREACDEFRTRMHLAARS